MQGYNKTKGFILYFKAIEKTQINKTGDKNETLQLKQQKYKRFPQTKIFLRQ